MYSLSEAAAKDIEEILQRSLADFGVEQTQIYYDSLRQCLALLGDNPAMGRAAEDIRPGYRRFPHESHVVFYRSDKDAVVIVRIVHKRMEPTRIE